MRAGSSAKPSASPGACGQECGRAASADRTFVSNRNVRRVSRPNRRPNRARRASSGASATRRRAPERRRDGSSAMRRRPAPPGVQVVPGGATRRRSRSSLYNRTRRGGGIARATARSTARRLASDGGRHGRMRPAGPGGEREAAPARPRRPEVASRRDRLTGDHRRAPARAFTPGGSRRRPARERIGHQKSAASIASLAAILPQVRGEGAERIVVGPVVVESPLSPALQDASLDEPFQVMAQRRGRKADVLLDRTCGCPLLASLNHEAQHIQSHRVAQRRELSSMMV
ncbi:uncharacterized protein SOCEGT47_078560 [Sorangium cellulosum]|uniref:Uncharacterized protein n=1 Tax=Sorangium cellulosum TaxID=56 RepID=A0A4V0NET3_SORCE|nr:uncharacterized protein SOCEGT47_078560 [Sorangium cellulosum]